MPETLREAARDGLGSCASGPSARAARTASGPSARQGDWPRKHRMRPEPGRWNEDSLAHLDRVIVEAGRNNLRVQLCLTNWWRDTGGVTQYLHWAGITDAADERHPFGINMERAMLFYTNETTRKLYREHVEKIVTRRNTVTGVLYRDDPTIFGWELMNEAQAPTGRWAERRAWVAEMSAYIKSLDPDHLVAPGTWGYRTSWERREWLEEHRLPTVDYCDVHNYPRDDHDSFVDSPQALRSSSTTARPPLSPSTSRSSSASSGWGRKVTRIPRPSGIARSSTALCGRRGRRNVLDHHARPAPRLRRDLHDAARRSRARGDSPRRGTLRRAPGRRAAPDLLDPSPHLVPRQFAFARDAGDPATTQRSSCRRKRATRCLPLRAGNGGGRAL